MALLPGVVLRLPLSTLLGLDDRPGELPGLGPITGHRAMDIARRRAGARWQLLLHDPTGALEYLLDLGPPPGATTNRRRRQTVEITAETGFFEALEPDDYDPDRRELLRRARAALEDLQAHPDKHPAVSTADRDRRFPGPALAAWVRARDQRCPVRACTRPARDNDLDHTVAWDHGGTTEAANLSPPCRAHHTRKHRAWQLRQPRPGRFVITDPTGTEHHTVSRVVDPLPEPCPPVEEEPDRLPVEAFLPAPAEPADPWRPRRRRDGRLTPEARKAAAHLADRARRLRGDPPTRYDADPDF
ncbi:MAG: HNH endonuclease [Marmoricola sp.]|nr:HNH endonuclease [Marmoricola sp.]